MRKIEERLRADPKLVAELQAFLKRAEVEDAATTKQLERMKVDLDAGQRRHQADRLVSELYGTSYGHDGLRTALEEILAQPVEALDEAARIKRRRRHESQRLVQKIAELKGELSANTESQIQEKLERTMAAAKAAASWESNNNARKTKS